MAKFLDVLDIEDDVLADLIQESDVEAASTRIVSIARSLGVSESEIYIPLVDEVKELAIAIACERRAKYATGTATASYEGGDVYTAKYKMYASDIIRLRAQITASLLTNNVNSASDISYCIDLSRG